MKLSPGQRLWYDRIEQLAYARLAQLRAKKCADDTVLWDGSPPVPVEHVAEQVLGLSISYEPVEERAGEEILGCLRPETGEIVLNDHHSERFRNIPGVERFTIGHECGHADVFGQVALRSAGSLFPESHAAPVRPKRSASKGEVTVLELGANLDVFNRITRGLSREDRTKVMRRLKEDERSAIASGADSPLVRRAVDHYAASLLMPADLVRLAVKAVDLSANAAIRLLAKTFEVSRQAMSIQLEYLGLIYGIDDRGAVLLENPRHEGQIKLI